MEKDDAIRRLSSRQDGGGGGGGGGGGEGVNDVSPATSFRTATSFRNYDSMLNIPKD